MLRAFLAKPGVITKSDSGTQRPGRPVQNLSERGVAAVDPAVVIVQPPPKESGHAATKDSSKGWYDWHSEVDLPLKIEAEIRYVDGEGQKTTRRITTRRFVAYPDGCNILAYCHLRRQSRTFKSARIQEFVDISTGEFVADIPEYLRKAYDESPTGRTNHLLAKVGNELVVLLNIALADGRLSHNEKAILVAFLRRTAPEVTLDMARVEVAMTYAPSPAALMRALEVVGAEGRGHAVLKDVEAIAAAGQKTDDFTLAALGLVRTRLCVAAATKMPQALNAAHRL